MLKTIEGYAAYAAATLDGIDNLVDEGAGVIGTLDPAIAPALDEFKIAADKFRAMLDTLVKAA